MNKICYRSYDCPKCGLNLQIPYIVSGLHQVYSGKVICKTPACKDISKHFFKHLISEGIQWKWGKVPVPPKEKPVKPPKPPKAKKTVLQKKVFKSPETKKTLSASDQCNPREKKAIQGLLAGKSKKDALISAGYSKSIAETKPSKIFGKGRVQQTIQEILINEGVTEEKLAQTLAEGLDAKKVISAMVIAPGGEGMKDANSMTKDFIEVPDHDARHKFMVSGLKLHGHLQSSQGAGPAAGAPETYEQWRERMGLNRMTPQEALDKLMEKKAALLAREEAEGTK